MDIACSGISQLIVGPFAESELRYNGSEYNVGHWTNYLFPKVEPPVEGILRLFEVAMGRWAEEVESALRVDARNRVSLLSRFRLGSQKRKERHAIDRKSVV